MIKVAIGIQARSTSERFPRKVFEMVGDKSILKHVIDSCVGAEKYINRKSDQSGISVHTYVLIPYHDEILTVFKNQIDIIEGPENDVLDRYFKMCVFDDCDYIVRVTSDCPLIRPDMITRHIQTAVHGRYDYISNVDEDIRTSIDGDDVEVLSKKTLCWLKEAAHGNSDKEHVTTMLRRLRPPWLKLGFFIGYRDLSMIKLSVDTREDLEKVRQEYSKINDKIKIAESIGGKKSVHRF